MIELKTLGHGAIRRRGEEPEGIGRHKQKFALHRIVDDLEENPRHRSRT